MLVLKKKKVKNKKKEEPLLNSECKSKEEVEI